MAEVTRRNFLLGAAAAATLAAMPARASVAQASVCSAMASMLKPRRIFR